MMPSTSTAPTYGVQDWVTILHNAARTPQDHPRYAEARQVAQLAVDNIDELQRKKSAADPEAKAPGPVGSALVSFGHGASLGLAGDSQYLAQAHEANPWTSGIADALGTAALGTIAAPLVAGAGAAAGGVVLGGGLGAARGAIEPIPGLSRGESALAMGTGGAVAGAVAGKLVSKLVPVAVTVAKNVYKVFGGGAAKAASPAVQDVAEAAVRAELKRLNVHPAVADRTVQAWKTGKVPRGAIDLPPMEPTVSRVGETITPLEPQLPTLRAQADVMATQPAYVRAGNPNNLPTGTGRALPMVKPIQAKGGTWIDENTGAPLPFTKTASSADVHSFYAERGQLSARPLPLVKPVQAPNGTWIDEATGAPLPFTKEASPSDVHSFYAGRGQLAPPQAGMPLGVPGTLQALEQHMGRPLTPPETQSVLERLLGPAGTPIPRSYGRPP